jgi:diguanylate cyclase (GGDEF)-like protein
MNQPQKAGKLLSLFAAPSTQSPYLTAGSQLQLTHQLQASLDIEEILQRFSAETKPFIPHDYLGYTNEQKNCAFSIGKNARHQLNYQLTIQGERLGQLVLSRRRKFSPNETAALEHLLGALHYPMRNALLYRDAIRAAHKDALTGIGNRAALNEALSREIEVAQRHNRSLGMIVFDIDHFKKINDTYGHATGDCLLKTITRAADDTIRLSDQLFRYGGEEFIVLLPETSIKGVKRLAERIRRNIKAMECVCEGHHIKMTASFGVAILTEDDNEDSFFIRADKALYQAKQEGRDCTRVAK